MRRWLDGSARRGSQLLHTFGGIKADVDALHHSFVPAIPSIRHLMIEATDGPSWVA